MLQKISMKNRGASILRLATIFFCLQVLSFVVLSMTFGSYARLSVWLHGLAGPFIAVEGISRFRYHSFLENAAYLLAAVLIFIVATMYVVAPGRKGLIASSIGILAWISFGLAQSVHHM